MKKWIFGCAALFPLWTMADDPPSPKIAPPAAEVAKAKATSSLGGLTDAQALDIIKVVDDRQRNSGDYTSLVYVKETEKKKDPRVFQAMVYRRDKDDKFLILFTKPKEEAGKGYLKIDKNLWMYDPNTGKWERRTERERIAGTNSRREDFDESRLAEEYTVKFSGSGTLGTYKTYTMRLTAKEGKDVAYPVIDLTVDQENKNVLKREEFSLSGKKMRSTYYPKWNKKFSESKKGDVWIPEELRIFDELEKENSTIVLIKESDLKNVDGNIFTKAWIESKSK
jgi:outer membrane lipoprotein-sorting protein